MGVWIEATGSNQAIIRDIATGKKSGYELDSAHFLTNANWWFWGDLGSFHLDAEISVWDTDKTLFRANSLASESPFVSLHDGFQSLCTLPFSWMYNANDSGIGSFNKMGFTIGSPWVNVKIGYGTLKANGMIDFKGIYYVIDRWDDQGKGFTEVSLGNDLRKIGNLTFDATAAFTMMRGTYAMYDLLRVRYGSDEKNPVVDAVLTFASESLSTSLFDYGDEATNAASAYISVNPFSPLTLEAHVLGTFGSGITFGSDTLAYAGCVSWKADRWSVSVMESFSGVNVKSVLGSDGQKYDTIRPGKIFTQFDADISIFDFLSIGLDEGLSFANGGNNFYMSNVATSEASFELRNQPYVDVDFSPFAGTDLTLGAYGVISIDTIPVGAKNYLITNFEGAGMELFYAPDFTALKNIRLDYALQTKYNAYTPSKGFVLNTLFHSVMLASDITENFSINGAFLYRGYTEMSETSQPLGFALGCAFDKTPLPGHPKFWTHFAYGMDPYEDNNYSVYRADNEQNKPIHRTYMLNKVDENMTKSFIRLGLIWNL